jgi:hypothetical protein
MNFYLNDSAAEFELDNRDLKFYPNNRAIEFPLNGSQGYEEGSAWILSTGFWNDDEIWKDEESWKDTP